MTQQHRLSLFAGFGIELEYMVVDRSGLAVRPLVDQLLTKAAGELVGDYFAGDTVWSNELVLHVLELKTNGPAATLDGVAGRFQRDVQRINGLLAEWDATLLPTGMHPWMDPYRELRLWPHDNGEIYAALNRVFDCRGHGWANLQSMHINLPFSGDDEFGRLHAAIRVVLPILPALAASTPIADGLVTGRLDTRLEVYRKNSQQLPSLTGLVIPEPVFTRHAYEHELLARLYADIAPHDPEGILQEEWINGRGAIARFERDTIEIRVLDMQECPRADLAVAEATVAVVRALVEERWATQGHLREWEAEPLAAILLDTIRDADRAVIDDRAFLDTFGFPGRGRARADELWQHLIETLLPQTLVESAANPAANLAANPAANPAAIRAAAPGAAHAATPTLSRAPAASPSTATAADLHPLRRIVREGCLARRILRALELVPKTAAAPSGGTAVPAERMRAVYAQLAECLASGRTLQGAA